ncbi:transposase [Salmonella enterica]|nr:transposase [Salmonella enterica]
MAIKNSALTALFFPTPPMIDSRKSTRVLSWTTNDSDAHLNLSSWFRINATYPDLQLTALIATEECPDNDTRVEWKLLTDLPVTNLAEATEKLEWYSHRWKIETFHKVMKSGCQAERSRLGSAERLTNLLCCYCILSWRIFWLTMLSREVPTAPAEIAFSDTELKYWTRWSKTQHKSCHHLHWKNIR